MAIDLVVETELEGLFDRDDSFSLIDLRGHGPQQSGLSGVHRAGYENVALCAYRSSEQERQVLVERLEPHEVAQRVISEAMPSDVDHRPLCDRHHRRKAAAIRKPQVELRLRRVEAALREPKARTR